MLFWGHVSGDCGSFSDSFYVYSPEVSWHNLCVNEYREKTVTIENPYLRNVSLCALIQCSLQLCFQIF